MIYLDNNATTKIDKRVYYKQCEILNRCYGNPSSQYPYGLEAKERICNSRNQISALINANIFDGDRIIFTSCATESNNSVFYSVLQPQPYGKHIIVPKTEHPSVLRTAEYYKSIGCDVTQINVNENGVLDEKQLLTSVRKETVLVSVMLVNSETGVINDVKKITKQIKEIREDIFVHTDAVQAAGKIPINVHELDVDFLTLSGHKFNAPKGIGVLYIKSGIPFTPFMLGGHQEFDLRSGTENTASIVAIGEAAIIAKERLDLKENKVIESLRNLMEKKLRNSFPDSIVFGANANRVGNTTNIGFKGFIGDKLVLQLAKQEICVSSGTACNSFSAEPSNVLKAMNVPNDYIRSIRISLGYDNSEADIDSLIYALKKIMKK